MANYRKIFTDFWGDPIVIEEMTPKDRYFYLYLLTNANTTKNGIYRITVEQMATHLGYSIGIVKELLKRFIEHHKLICYDFETEEIVIKNFWEKTFVKL